MQVNPVNPKFLTAASKTAGPGAKDQGGKDFMKVLQSSLDQVNQQQLSAQQQLQALASGQSNDIAGTMIALQKADLGIRLTAAVRNKLVDAYNEIMRMQF